MEKTLITEEMTREYLENLKKINELRLKTAEYEGLVKAIAEEEFNQNDVMTRTEVGAFVVSKKDVHYKVPTKPLSELYDGVTVVRRLVIDEEHTDDDVVLDLIEQDCVDIEYEKDTKALNKYVKDNGKLPEGWKVSVSSSLDIKLKEEAK